MGEFRENLVQLPLEDQRYLLETLPGFLVSECDTEQLHRLLTDFDFLESRLYLFGVEYLLNDYEEAMHSDAWISGEKLKTLKFIQGAIELSSHILVEDKTQLAEQLWGRLLSFEIPEIQQMLQQAKSWKVTSWLRPIAPSLTPPGGRLLRTFTGHSGWVNAIVVTSGGMVISGSSDNTLKVWNPETGKEISTITGHAARIRAIALLDDKWVISGSDDFTIKVWDLETTEELVTLTGHTRAVRAVAALSDGRVISGSSDNTIKVWNLETQKVEMTLRGHQGWVNAVSVLSDQEIISGSSDNTIKIWSLETGESYLHSKVIQMV